MQHPPREGEAGEERCIPFDIGVGGEFRNAEGLVAVERTTLRAAQFRIDHRQSGDQPQSLDRLAVDAEFDAAVALLASDRGGYFVGATLDMNGGLYMR